MKLLLPTFLLVSLMPFCALAENSEPKHYLDSPHQVLRVAPGGRDMASLRQGIPVKMLETKGDWAKVAVEGWVRKTTLGLRTARKKAGTATTTTKKPISLAKYKIQHLTKKETGKDTQVVLDLTVKNNGPRKINAWNGILIVQSLENNSVLFNTAVRHDSANIEPGKTGTVSFFWWPGEKPYDVLTAVSPENVRLLLHKVKPLY